MSNPARDLLNVVDEDKTELVNKIQRWMDKTNIKVNDDPTEKDPNRKRYIINNKPLAEALGYKGKQVRSADYSKLYAKKLEGIAKLCMVNIDEVKEVMNQNK